MGSGPDCPYRGPTIREIDKEGRMKESYKTVGVDDGCY